MEEFTTRLRANEGFSRLGQQELEILAHGLLRPEGGQMTLRCPRQFEAVLYNESFEDLYDRLNKVDVKTTVVAGGAGLARLELARDVAENGGFAFHEFEGCTHFMLMEEPKAISCLVRDVLFGKS